MKPTKFNLGIMVAVNGRVKVTQNVTAALGKQFTAKQAIAHAKQVASTFAADGDFIGIDIFADNHHIASVEAWKEGRKINFEVSEIAGIIKVDEDNTPETTTPSNDTTMKEETTNAPAFDSLSHAAVNIVLTAENDGDIYRRYVKQLVNSLAKKVTKGVQLNASTLASFGAVANIIRESIKGMKLSGWTNPVTASDRKQAAAYLASVYISDAIENAEYINA